ncbi:MAG: TatD family deoxyribonuclease, partial [Tissierellia bacterium]|nr:TatD family deoxyribonuclease [Tissierellia bacterium]
LTDEIVRYLPIDRILTETDGPTALEWVNGNYGYPDYLVAIVEKIADIKNMNLDEVKHRINKNLLRLMSS